MIKMQQFFLHAFLGQEEAPCCTASTGLKTRFAFFKKGIIVNATSIGEIRLLAIASNKFSL
jgi:hypothetical protein